MGLGLTGFCPGGIVLEVSLVERIVREGQFDPIRLSGGVDWVLVPPFAKVSFFV